jgi:hypothetical protein
MWEDDLKRRELVKNMKVDNAKAILKNDYASWWEHFPTDTQRVVNLFLDQMDSTIKMQPAQRKLRN